SAGALCRGRTQDSATSESRGRRGEGVLPFVVVGTGDVEGARNRISATNPCCLKNLVRREGRVVYGTRDQTSLEERAGVKRVVRIGVGDVLVATEELPRSDGIARTDREHGVVGNRDGDLAVSHGNRWIHANAQGERR